MALGPFAALTASLRRVRQLWAHVRLRSEISGQLDPSVVVIRAPHALGTRRVRLGKNLLLYPDITFETQGDGTIEIGDNVVISRGVHVVAFSSIIIGADCMIGEYASIRDANHCRVANQSLRDSPHQSSAIRIGANSWIGRGVSVLSGAQIGDGVTVGANAVVTRNLPSGCVAVGIPARPRPYPPK